jgi:hypothetical protein
MTHFLFVAMLARSWFSDVDLMLNLLEPPDDLPPVDGALAVAVAPPPRKRARQCVFPETFFMLTVEGEERIVHGVQFPVAYHFIVPRPPTC